MFYPSTLKTYLHKLLEDQVLKLQMIRLLGGQHMNTVEPVPSPWAQTSGMPSFFLATGSIPHLVVHTCEFLNL